MKVKVYKVYPKKQTGDEDRFWYFVDAPSKRIAKWCGAAHYNNEYAAFLKASDMVAEHFRCTETNNEEVYD